MRSIYLFDWGDSLMVDYPQYSGKMYDWPEVSTVVGAQEVLSFLAQRHKLYVATNAAESTEQDIRNAFMRADLAQYISGYFCKATLGLGKGSPEFYLRIASTLAVKPTQLIMVGDSLDKDILPAIAAGLTAVWFKRGRDASDHDNSYRIIRDLRQLC
ncbi:HAD family hydrolase [Rheinheimera sp.]|uniref:HAD family hydrolase n=1 Tax=Rheinheimera sp. TaxID=1869214 RepID=UPI002354FF24|nr:HAD family hydrolase [Rheinheimera sp.]